MFGRNQHNTVGEGNGTPLQYSCLENPMDGGAWWASVHAVAGSQTWLSDFTFTFHFHALEKEMATHSSVLAWRISGTGEPSGLLSIGSHRVRHDWSDLAVAAAGTNKGQIKQRHLLLNISKLLITIKHSFKKCKLGACCAVSFSHVRLFATLWTVAHQTPLSMRMLQTRLLEWVAMPSSRGSSQPRNQTQVSSITGGFFTV